jgi:uracil-DNA glycosylase
LKYIIGRYLPSEIYRMGHAQNDLAILKEISDRCMREVDNMRSSGMIIRPDRHDILRATIELPFNRVKVIFIGLDPYANPRDIPHGLSFSSLGKTIPHSLRRIYGALEHLKLIQTIPKTARLDNWFNQGVMLLNTYLTVQQGIRDDEHRKHLFWEEYTTKVVSIICKLNPNTCIILLGAIAKKTFSRYCNNVFTHSHPAAQNGDFIRTCTVFRDVNAFLISRGICPIEWNPEIVPILPIQEPMSMVQMVDNIYDVIVTDKKICTWKYGNYKWNMVDSKKSVEELRQMDIYDLVTEYYNTTTAEYIEFIKIW